MSEIDELAFLPATEQARLVRNKEVSPVELVSTYLERIEKFDSTLNTFVTVVADAARAQAQEAERVVSNGDQLGPFHGVPISIKDLNQTAGIKTTFSSKAFADNVPTVDDSTIRRIKDAGFIVLGKSNTPEFGTIPMTESDLNGICRNPWNPDHTPGGSSGGAAAGVAAGLSPIAQGSDGGGSIRIPSSCCGLFGIKPARGRVSNAPAGESLAGLSTDGPIARTVRDAAAMLDVISGYETGDPYWAPEPGRPFVDEVGADPGKLRIGFTADNPLQSPVDPACMAALQDAAQLLESLGHTVEEAQPDADDPNASSYFVTIWSTLAAYYGDVPLDQMEPLNKTLTELSAGSTSSDYVKAVAAVHRLSRRVLPFWNDYDFLLTPTLCLPPVPVGWIKEEEDPWAQFARSGLFAAFTPSVNLTGQPAVSLPLYWSDEGLPIGVQLIGRPADESSLFRISAQLEQARPWIDRRPPVS
jgi:amidase